MLAESENRSQSLKAKVTPASAARVSFAAKIAIEAEGERLAHEPELEGPAKFENSVGQLSG